MKTPLFFIISLILQVNLTFQEPTGHNKPLGSHEPPFGVTLIGKFSSPNVFYYSFVRESQPLLMKSPLVDARFPAYKYWSEEFLRDEYGSETVSVEKSKKEKRTLPAAKMKFSEFLKIFHTENVYMVQSLPNSMKGEVHLPITLQCGGFQDVLQDSVIWLSSGNTKSVLHYDKLDNLLCVLRGSKDVLLIDKIYQSEVEADGFDQNGTFSRVDVDSVNLYQFPKLGKVPWHRAHLDAGDCIYIPYKWYHQINSSGGEEHLSLAINFWFSHRWWHNTSDCKNFETFNITEPLSKFTFASPNEQMRSYLLEPLSGLEEVKMEDFVSSLLAERSQTEELFRFISEGKTVLSWEDLYKFSIDETLKKFPDVFAAGVKLLDPKLKKNIKRETIHVQQDFGDETENFINVPMLVPDSGEHSTEDIPGMDKGPMIQDINVKVTKGDKKVAKDTTMENDNGEKKKLNSQPNHTTKENDTGEKKKLHSQTKHDEF